jgi:hypothetical protein
MFWFSYTIFRELAGFVGYSYELFNDIIQCGTAVAQCLRYCATNQKVAGSIPDGVIGIFH